MDSIEWQDIPEPIKTKLGADIDQRTAAYNDVMSDAPGKVFVVAENNLGKTKIITITSSIVLARGVIQACKDTAQKWPNKTTVFIEPHMLDDNKWYHRVYIPIRKLVFSGLDQWINS